MISEMWTIICTALGVTLVICLVFFLKQVGWKASVQLLARRKKHHRRRKRRHSG